MSRIKKLIKFTGNAWRTLSSVPWTNSEGANYKDSYPVDDYSPQLSPRCSEDSDTDPDFDPIMQKDKNLGYHIC